MTICELQIKASTKLLRYTIDSLSSQTKLIFSFWQVTDSQCPGVVLGDGSTYKVGWIPRPSAKLSPSTEATYAAHNGSHILQPICEGMNGHVDLDLTGMKSTSI